MAGFFMDEMLARKVYSSSINSIQKKSPLNREDFYLHIYIKAYILPLITPFSCRNS